MLEIPDDYVSIKSGVGESSPGSILVVPLKVNENIYGVLEIASFKEFSKEQIDFIEKVGETIAGTMYNVKNAAQTKKLLEDSQENEIDEFEDHIPTSPNSKDQTNQNQKSEDIEDDIPEELKEVFREDAQENSSTEVSN